MERSKSRFCENLVETIEDERKLRNTPQKKEKKSRKKDRGSDSDSVASSQFLEQLLECDRIENGNLNHFFTVEDTPIPHSFISVTNYFNKHISPYNPYQKKTLDINAKNKTLNQKEAVSETPKVQSVISPEYQEHYDHKSILTEFNTNLPDVLPQGKMNHLNGITRHDDIMSIHPSSRSYEKEELKGINDRFSSYIQYVRGLGEVSNQVDSSAFLKSTKILEEEINSLKNLYETELDKLRNDNEELVKEKNNSISHFKKSKQTVGELEDRLAVEMDRNHKLNDELNMYHQRVADYEVELNEAKIAANRPLLEIEQLQRNIENLTRDGNSWKNRYEHEEMSRQEDQEKIQQLIKKLDFNDQINAQQSKELHDRLESSANTILSLEAKIRDLGKADTNISDLLRQVRDASDNEIKKYKEECEEQHSRNISTLKHQLDEDKNTIKQLSYDKQFLETGVNDLQNKLKSVDGQISLLHHEKRSLEEMLNQERSRAVDQTKLLEKKLQDLQDALFDQIQEVTNARDANIPLKTEIEALKALLEEEERRLRLPLTVSSPTRYPPTSPTLAFQPSAPTTANNYISNYSRSQPLTPRTYTSPIISSQPYSPRAYSAPSRPYSPKPHPAAVTSLSYPSRPYSPKLSQPSYIHPIISSDVNDTVDFTQTQSYEPFTTDVHHLLDLDDQSPELFMPTDKYMYESSPSFSRLQCESGSSLAVRPVGPIRAKSAPSQSRNVQLVPTGLGQGQDYFDEMFKDLAQDTLQAKIRPKSSPVEHGVSSTHHDYNTATSSSTGDIKVLEVHQDGKFIRMVNEGVKDYEFGGYMIQQNVGGHPVAVYRFPPRTKFSANTTITVWSGMNETILHQPPTDYVWKEQLKWGTGPECTTILCKPNGQAIAWTTASHRFTNNTYEEETSEVTDSVGEVESLTELPVDYKSEQVYLRREKQQPPSLSPQKHPHGTSPAISTHPHTNTAQSYILGRNTVSRSSGRSQARPDILNNAPVPRVGSAPVRKTQTTLKGNGTITNKPAGKIRFGSPTPFYSPLQQEFSQSSSRARNTPLVRFTT